jgi:hypothetical protein
MTIGVETEGCTACECRWTDPEKCDEQFTCLTCGRTFSCCTSMPGWPNLDRHDECILCWELRVMGPEWYTKWVTRKGRPWKGELPRGGEHD